MNGSGDGITSIMADELRGLAPMELVLRPETVLVLVGVLQLATRHPRLPTSTHEFVDRFIASARDYFADCPFVLDTIAMGDDPKFDI